MKRLITIAACAALVLMAAGTVHAKGGPWKAAVWQFGVPTADVQADNVFDVRGAGFHARPLPVKVCVDGRQCMLADPDGSGDFVVSRSLSAPGTYEIQVFQARNPHISEWVMRASQTVTVSN